MFHVPAPSVRLLVFLAIGWLALAQQAQAVYTIHIQQIGPNVQVVGSGSLDLAALTPTAMAPGGSLIGSIEPNLARVTFPVTVPNSLTAWQMVGGAPGPADFGIGPNAVASTSSDDGLMFLPDFGALIYLPTTYVSNNPLNSGMWFVGQSLASLGLTPGTYTWNFNNGAHADSVIVQIDPAPPVPPAPTAIPTLSEWGLLGLSALMAALGLGWLRRRPGA